MLNLRFICCFSDPSSPAFSFDQCSPEKWPHLSHCLGSCIFTEYQALYKLLSFSMAQFSLLKSKDGHGAHFIELYWRVNTRTRVKCLVQLDIFKHFHLIFKTFSNHVPLYMSNHTAYFSSNSDLSFQSLSKALWQFPLWDLFQVLFHLCHLNLILVLGFTQALTSPWSLHFSFSKSP